MYISINQKKIMLLFYRYQVLEDGCLIDNDNGRVIQPLTKRNKKDVAPFHLVKDDNGKFHYFSVKFLMEKLGVDLIEIEVEVDKDYKSAEHYEFSSMSSKDRLAALLELI